MHKYINNINTVLNNIYLMLPLVVGCVLMSLIHLEYYWTWILLESWWQDNGHNIKRKYYGHFEFLNLHQLKLFTCLNPSIRI